MRRRTTLPWEGRGKESSREGESECRGPEVLGTGLHDGGTGRSLVWPQRSGWGRGEGWGARPSCRGRSAPASRFGTPASNCPVRIAPKCSLSVFECRNQVTESEGEVGTTLVHRVMQGATGAFPRCLRKHPALHSNHSRITAASVLQLWGPVSLSTRARRGGETTFKRVCESCHSLCTCYLHGTQAGGQSN